uniref:Exonuclease 1 n=1 Tax=Latimeria chalumnae TaxID=7897 RepID=H3BBZ0_LATCH
MGIQGLLQFLKEASEPIHIRKYKGQTVAVDTYCWLHKGAFSCADKLVRGEPTDQYVAYCMKFVDMLLANGVKPILVFDGCTLPSKMKVEKARKERRQLNLQKGKQLLREGKVAEARDCFSRCVNITSAMAHNLIKIARIHGVDCIVAPYEADAQLAFLNKKGIAQAIITEDSDLLAFGCKKVILKMDKYGNGLEIDQAQLGKCKQLGNVFTEEKFRYMCILSGCDYLPSIHGIGLGRACKLLRITNNPDIIKVIKKIGQYLKTNINVPDEYIEGFIRANNTFLYQLVFDPLQRKLVPLNPYAEDIDSKSLDYAGHHMGDKAALQIALGNTDINTMESVDDYNPDISQPAQARSRGWNERDLNSQNKTKVHSIWSKDYKARGAINSVTEPVNPSEKPCTRGVEKVISTKGLRLPNKGLIAKRPREEDISEVDLLSQYFFSSMKKAKEVNTEEPFSQNSSSSSSPEGSALPAPADGQSQPRVRNKFSVLLQKRNEDDGAIFVPGTRSRFFCNSQELSDSMVNQEVEKGTDSKVVQSPNEALRTASETKELFSTIDSETEEQNSLPLEMGQPNELGAEPPSQAKQGSGCFSWSGGLGVKLANPSLSSGLSSLQQFQRKKSDLSWYKRKSDASVVLSEKDDQNILNEECTSMEAECSVGSQRGFSLSQGSLCTGVDSLNFSQSSKEDAESHVRKLANSYNDCLSSLPAQWFPYWEKPVQGEFPGLHKTNSGVLRRNTKVKASGPVRVSGLSKKSAGVSKKAPPNDENKPGVQVKINEMWKNFGFKKDSERIQPFKNSEAMFLVKDNIQV